MARKTLSVRIGETISNVLITCVLAVAGWGVVIVALETIGAVAK